MLRGRKHVFCKSSAKVRKNNHITKYFPVYFCYVMSTEAKVLEYEGKSTRVRSLRTPAVLLGRNANRLILPVDLLYIVVEG